MSQAKFLQSIPEVEAAAGASPPESWRLLRICTARSCEVSWRLLVERHGPDLERAVRRMLLAGGPLTEPGLVQDLMQEVYLRLVAGWRRPASRFRGASDGEARAYLRRVAATVVLDSRRDARADKRGGGAKLIQLDPEVAEALPAPPGDSPEYRVERRERRRLFRHRCRALLGRRASARTIRVAELAIVDGLSSREIVAASGHRLRETGVNSTVFRLRRRLERSGVRIPPRVRRTRRSHRTRPAPDAGRSAPALSIE
jgi:hypothetical protein